MSCRTAISVTVLTWVVVTVLVLAVGSLVAHVRQRKKPKEERRPWWYAWPGVLIPAGLFIAGVALRMASGSPGVLTINLTAATACLRPDGAANETLATYSDYLAGLAGYISTHSAFERLTAYGRKHGRALALVAVEAGFFVGALFGLLYVPDPKYLPLIVGMNGAIVGDFISGGLRWWWERHNPARWKEDAETVVGEQLDVAASPSTATDPVAMRNTAGKGSVHRCRWLAAGVAAGWILRGRRTDEMKSEMKRVRTRRADVAR